MLRNVVELLGGKPRSSSLDRHHHRRRRRHRDSHRHRERTHHRARSSLSGSSLDKSSESVASRNAGPDRGPDTDQTHKRPPLAGKTCWERAKQILEKTHSDDEFLSKLDQIFGQEIRETEHVVNTMTDLVGKSEKVKGPDGQRLEGTVKPALQSIMKCVLAFKDCGASITALDPHGIAPIVWGGTMLILKVCLDGSNAAENALSEIRDICQIIASYMKVEDSYLSCRVQIPDEEFAKKLTDMYAQILEYQVYITHYLDVSSTRRFLKGIMGDSKRKKLLEDIMASDKECERYLTRDNVVNSKDMREMLLQAKKETKITADIIEDTHKLVNDKRISDMLDSISRASPESMHRKIFRENELSSTYPFSSQWLFEHSSYNKWDKDGAQALSNQGNASSMSNPSQATIIDDAKEIGPRCLWVHGPVGSGKTIVMARAIEHGIKQAFGKQGEEVAFFYCSRSNKRECDPETILRSFVRQLAISQNGNEVAKCIERNKFKQGTAMWNLDSEACLTLLEELLVDCSTVTVYIDALDEMRSITSASLDWSKTRDPVQEILTYLYDLSIRVGDKLRFCFSGQEHIRVDAGARNFTIFPIRIDTDNTGKELESYIEVEAGWRRNFFHSPEMFKNSSKHDEDPAIIETGCRDMIILVLKQRSEGMFKWTELQLDVLFRSFTVTGLKQRCEVIQQGMSIASHGRMKQLYIVYEVIYQTNMEGCTKDEEEYVKRAYQFVLCSAIPLTSRALAEATSKDFNHKTLRVTANDILRMSRGLLREDSQSLLVSFTHSSVVEFWLERSTCREGENSSDNLREVRRQEYLQDCHIAMTEACFSLMHGRLYAKLVAGYLRWHEQKLPNKDETMENTRHKLPGFIHYASYYWPIHLKNATGTVMNGAALRTRENLQPPSFDLFRAFTKAGSSQHRLWRDYIRCSNSPRSSPNIQQIKLSDYPQSLSALAICVIWDMQNLAEYICAQDEQSYVDDLTATDEEGRSLVHLAAKYASAPFLRHILVTTPRDSIEVETKSGHRALYYALNAESYENVQLLLDFGASIEATNSEGINAVHRAATKPNRKMLELLIVERRQIRTPRWNEEGTSRLRSTDGELGLQWELRERLQDIPSLLRIEADDGWTVLRCACAFGALDNAAMIMAASTKTRKERRALAKDTLSYLLDNDDFMLFLDEEDEDCHVDGRSLIRVVLWLLREEGTAI